MGDLARVKSFLEVVAGQDKFLEETGQKTGKFPFITISREAGAGGHTLAAAILEAFEKEEDSVFQGWQMFDQELCSKVAKEPGLKVYLDRLMNIEYHSEIEDLVQELINQQTPQSVVIQKMFELIRTLALCGKAILVGRAGSFLTRDLPLGVHFRLIAPWEVRVKRMAQLLHVPEPKAREMTLEQDKARAQLVKTYFNHNIADPLHYDVVWNTAKVPLETIARWAILAVREKMGNKEAVR